MKIMIMMNDDHDHEYDHDDEGDDDDGYLARYSLRAHTFARKDL